MVKESDDVKKTNKGYRLSNYDDGRCDPAKAGTRPLRTTSCLATLRDWTSTTSTITTLNSLQRHQSRSKVRTARLAGKTTRKRKETEKRKGKKNDQREGEYKRKREIFQCTAILFHSIHLFIRPPSSTCFRPKSFGRNRPNDKRDAALQTLLMYYHIVPNRWPKM